MPVWFVSWPELQTATSDGYLDIDELAGLFSLISGSASYYEETLRPAGENWRGKIVFSGEGLLEDGRAFTIFAAARDQIGGGIEMQVQIEFR